MSVIDLTNYGDESTTFKVPIGENGEVGKIVLTGKIPLSLYDEMSEHGSKGTFDETYKSIIKQILCIETDPDIVEKAFKYLSAPALRKIDVMIVKKALFFESDEGSKKKAD